MNSQHFVVAALLLVGALIPYVHSAEAEVSVQPLNSSRVVQLLESSKSNNNTLERQKQTNNITETLLNMGSEENRGLKNDTDKQKPTTEPELIKKIIGAAIHHNSEYRFRYPMNAFFKSIYQKWGPYLKPGRAMELIQEVKMPQLILIDVVFPKLPFISQSSRTRAKTLDLMNENPNAKLSAKMLASFSPKTSFVKLMQILSDKIWAPFNQTAANQTAIPAETQTQ